MELKIQSEKVLEAVEKCSAAKEVLKTLFPQVFEEDKSVDLTVLLDIKGYGVITETRELGKFMYVGFGNDKRLGGKSFILSRDYNWELKDVDGFIRLIPTKK